MKQFQKVSNPKLTIYELDGTYFLSHNGGKRISYTISQIENPDQFQEVESNRTAESLTTWLAERIEMEKQQRIASAAAAKAEYETRREFLLNLRAWRRGEKEAFIVDCGEQFFDDRSYNYEKERKLFFSEGQARDYYDSVKEVADPVPGKVLVTEITTTFNRKDRLEVTTEAELINYICQDNETVEMHVYSPSLPEDCVIITIERKQMGSRGRVVNVDDPRSWSGYLGDSDYYYHKQDTYATLAPNEDRHFCTYQLAMSLEEAIEEFGQGTIEQYYTIPA